MTSLMIIKIISKGGTHMATANIPKWRDATRQQSKASIVIEGLSGSGKSGLALALAYILADKAWDKVYSIDTENKSLDLFQGIQLHIGEPVNAFKKLDLLPMHGYAPSNYEACKQSAKEAGAQVVIQDSISHMWTGRGGILDLVSKAKAEDRYMDNYRVWGLPHIYAEKNAVFNTIRDSDVHVISTVRVKEKHEFVSGAEGKKELKSLGEQEIQMPDLKYEPDLVLSMQEPGSMNGTPPKAKVIKTRYAIFQKGEVYEFTESLMLQLKQYLAEGADPEILKEQQRVEYIDSITKLLDENASSRTIFPSLKEQIGKKDVALKDMELNDVRILYSMLIS